MEEIYRSQFRLPYSLYEQIKASADANHRSVNAELVARLEASFQKSYTFADAVIIDEAHRSEPKFSEADVKAAIDHAFSSILRQHVGMTATPLKKS